MDESINHIVAAFILAVSYFSLWFIIALFKKRLDVVDMAWGGGFVAVALMLYILNDSVVYFSQSLMLVMVAVWGIRLMTHIYRRNSSKPEADYYSDMRQKLQEPVLGQIFFKVYMMKAILLTAISLPVIGAFMDTDTFVSATVLAAGFAIWASGFAIEFFADNQLNNFTRKNKNKNKIMDSGLWRYSRHPNYFGEVVLWWGVWVASMGINPVWWSVIGPLTISFLILFVSGIPAIEKRHKQNAAYKEYTTRTSVFLPLPPKKKTV